MGENWPSLKYGETQDQVWETHTTHQIPNPQTKTQATSIRFREKTNRLGNLLLLPCHFINLSSYIGSVTYVTAAFLDMHRAIQSKQAVKGNQATVIQSKQELKLDQATVIQLKQEKKIAQTTTVQSFQGHKTLDTTFTKW